MDEVRSRFDFDQEVADALLPAPERATAGILDRMAAHNVCQVA